MKKQITNLLFLTILIPIILSNEAQFQDHNNLSKDLSNDSRPRSNNEQKTPEQYGLKHGNLLDEDSRSSQESEQKTKRRSRSYIEQKTSEHQKRSRNNYSNDLTRIIGQTSIHQSSQERNIDEHSRSSQIGETSEHDTAKKNPNVDSRLTQSEKKSPEHNGINKDFVNEDTRPIVDEHNTSKYSQNSNLVNVDTRPNLDEQELERHKKMNKDRSQTSKTPAQNDENRDLINNRPTLDEQIISENKTKNKKLTEISRPSLDEQKTPENYQNEDTTSPDESTTPEQHRHLTDKRPGHGGHTMVTDNGFAYMVAVLKGSTYVSAGALIDESWVLTAADGIHLMRETIKLIRIRLGSINYKKGGTLLPVKYLEVHPYFNSSKPTYDLALIMLSKPVRFTAKMRSIRLQLAPKEVTSTHFIMTSWPEVMKPGTNQSQLTGLIKHHRLLSVTHLHPSDPEECVEELEGIGAAHDGAMCLDSSMENSCLRDAGAPIVFNGVLWGIISSWKPEECDGEDSFIFATLVSARNISTWIHATVHGHRWHPKKELSSSLQP